MDQFIILLIGAVLNGLMLAVGMIIGTRLTAKSMRKEAEVMVEESETIQAIKKVITDQKLVDEATKFFQEARVLVSSPEAKNFFKNVTELMKQLGEKTEEKEMIRLPEKPS